ncbi:MAG TPA: MBL fold metallo-hydrolase [Thermoanaerobaculia bacterium]|nr:MBL fold metallo-hydrolase [Thermoanaerobaculia bacterium]HQR66949.1 MBL fold metallo-hydrolase [Thermoanaerobaculia bacterium]
MEFKQFYLGCLAHASYLIGSKGEAAVVDPQRDVDLYLQEADARGLEIRWVLETHLHADFVSGHRELAARTGATIVFGRRAGAAFPHRAAADGEEIRLGDARLRILETPGHTPESISILVTDAAVPHEPPKVLTGDTLFVGDVGRPDLAGSRGFTPAEMAGMLYDSLHAKLLTLPDAVEVFPAHGAGSLCGRNISRETSSTIGEQRRFNYALQPMSKDAFVRMMTADLPPAPAYFSRDAEMNRAGAGPLSELPPPVPLPPPAFASRIRSGAVVLDVRPAISFGTAHVPGSLNIGLGGEFASWAGSLLPAGTPIVLVAEDSRDVGEAVLRLARVGLEGVDSFLSGGILAWDRAGMSVSRIQQIAVDELRRRLEEEPRLGLLDVRRPGEYRAGHVPSAVSAPLDGLAGLAPSLDPSRPTAVICAGGYRSSAAASALAARGFSTLFNVVGGTAAWQAAGYPVEAA